MAPLKYEGCSLFRQRIVASLLSGNTLKVVKIREKDTCPGLQDYEANFLRFIEKITDGCRVEINETGTSFRFFPGILTGGKVTHDCGTSRSIGWFVEGILPLSVFCKNPLELTLTGVTNDSLDLSVDILKSVTIPLLMNFGIMNIQMKVKRRGAAPKGGGIVELFIPIVRTLKPIHIIDEGLVKRVRGVAFCTKISPTIVTRVIDSCRGVLNNLLPDVHIHTDHYKGKEGGDAPGYSLSLVAETTTGVLLSIERTANTRANSERGGGGELPEDIGTEGAMMLLKEIQLGGVVDSVHQPLMLQMMVLTPEDVSKIRFGELSAQAIATLRLLKDAFGVVFKIKMDVSTTVSYVDTAAATASAVEDDVSVEDMEDDDEEEGSDNDDNEDDDEDDSQEGSDGGFEYEQSDDDGDDDEDEDDSSDSEEDESESATNGKKKTKSSAAAGSGGGREAVKEKVTVVHNSVLLSCFGTGYTNVNRKVT